MFWQLLLEPMLTNIFRSFWSITRWQWVNNNKIIVAIVTDKSTLQLMDEGTISGPKLGYRGKVTRIIIHLAVRCLFVRFGAILPTSDTCCHCLPPGSLYVMARSCSKWQRFYFCDYDCIFYISKFRNTPTLFWNTSSMTIAVSESYYVHMDGIPDIHHLDYNQPINSNQADSLWL